MRLSETLRRLFPFHIILSILPVKEVEKSGYERKRTELYGGMQRKDVE